MKLRKFVFNKGTRFAILMALFYQIFMLGIYYYGYHAIPSNFIALVALLIGLYIVYFNRSISKQKTDTDMDKISEAVEVAIASGATAATE